MKIFLIENKRAVVIEDSIFVEAPCQLEDMAGEVPDTLIINGVKLSGSPLDGVKIKRKYRVKKLGKIKTGDTLFGVKVKKGRKGRLSEDQREAIVAEIKSGEKVSKVAKQFKVTPWSVYLILKKAGVNPKKLKSVPEIKKNEGSLERVRNFQCINKDCGINFKKLTAHLVAACPQCGEGADAM